jgi:hypothetical protein
MHGDILPVCAIRDKLIRCGGRFVLTLSQAATFPQELDFSGVIMSNLEDRHRAMTETLQAETARGDFAEKYAAARASIEADKRRKERAGYVWMAAAMSYGEAAEGPSRFGKVARASKWFMLWFAMIVPNLLLIRVAF